MTVSDDEILRTAQLWSDRHGDQAVAEVRKMATGLQEAGDRDGADVWLRILLVLEAMRGSAFAA